MADEATTIRTPEVPGTEYENATVSRYVRAFGWVCFALAWLATAFTLDWTLSLPESFWAGTICWLLFVTLFLTAGTRYTGAGRVGGFSFLGASVAAGFLAFLCVVDTVWPRESSFPLRVICEWPWLGALVMMAACFGLSWAGGRVLRQAGYADWREETVGLALIVALACSLALLCAFFGKDNSQLAAQVLVLGWGWAVYGAMRLGWLQAGKTFRGQVMGRVVFVAVLFVPFCVDAVIAIPQISLLRSMATAEARRNMPAAAVPTIEATMKNFYLELAVMVVSLAATVVAGIVEVRTLRRLWREKHPAAETR